MTPARFIPLPRPPKRGTAAMRRRARQFLEEMQRRRSVRHFSDQPVPRDLIECCVRTAGTAPSGANLQPWTFVVVSDPAVKRQIRVAAEAEERKFYSKRATPEWLQALKPLGTDASKPFLETAPCLIVIFAQTHGIDAQGRRIRHYYVSESVGIATGILITALHHAGLATLTHTPSPMGFLNRILGRPAREKPFLILVAGYPAAGARVPDLKRRPLQDISRFV